jgi:MFS family permease
VRERLALPLSGVLHIYHGWRIVAAVFLSAAVSIGSSQHAFGLFLEPLEQTFGWSRTQISAHLTNEGFSSTTAALALSVLAAFWMAGKVAFGMLAERITARYAMVTSFSGLTVAILLIQNPWSPTALWMTVPLFGLCMGAFGTLFTLIIQESFGLRSFGSITGVMSMATAAVGPLLGALAYDLTGDYRLAFIAVAAALASGALAMTQARPPRR